MHTNFRTKKRFGQHFLVDQTIIDLITKHINVKSNDLMVEIGPGNGAITKPLAQYKPKLHLIEFDRDLIPILHKKFKSDSNVIIHHEDALKFDYSYLVIAKPTMLNNEFKNIKESLFQDFKKIK